MQKKTHKATRTKIIGPTLTFLVAILLGVFIFAPELLSTPGLPQLNRLASAVVFLQGLWVLQTIWHLELQGERWAMPFVWCFLAIQHLSFGLGGLLVSFFDQDFAYENASGVYAFSDAVLPFLLAHALSMNVGLLATWFKLRRDARDRAHAPRSAYPELRPLLQWDQARPVCIISLAFHGLIWVVLYQLKLPDAAAYVVHAMAVPVNAAYLVWGLMWRSCRMKPIFLAYSACFVTLELIMGARGNAFIPLVLFGIGFAVSSNGRGWNSATALKWAPLALFIFWASISSENLRTQFARDNVGDADDASARVEALVFNSVSNDTTDAFGVTENAPFRFGSRLFEVSAADVIMRTPGDVPFWGWTTEDTSVFLTGFLPLKYNAGAAYNSSGNAGVLFLRTYGWIYVDPVNGSSMPATLVGDSWRRFGWVGIVAFYLGWCYVLATLTARFRRNGLNMLKVLLSSTLVAAYATQYDADIVGLVSNVPRRLLVIGIYIAIVWSLSKLMPQRQSGGSGIGSFVLVTNQTAHNSAE